ncbi:MAG: hypothetical protein HY051_05405 [Candidatus Aenigmarchaeota archaeon]|nr:hypothetical protein [Candidatus Aenigmarchaeota archaeon]
MSAQLSEEEMDILTAIMEGGDQTTYDKIGAGLKFLSGATDIEENKLKIVLKKLVKDRYVEHRFFSDGTDDYILREKGMETVNANL